MHTNSSFSTLADLLFEQRDDFVGIYDLATERFIRVNQAGYRMLGFSSAAEFTGQSDWGNALLTSTQHNLQHTDFIRKVNQLGYYEQEMTISRRDGTHFWGRLIGLPGNDDGNAYLFVRLIDLERLHQAERELKQSVQRYEAVFTSATIGILVSNQQGMIVSVNQMAGQLFGYSDNELAGQMIEVLVPVGVSRYHEKLRHSFNENPQVRSMGHNRDLHARRKDGSVFPVEISLSYFRLDEELYAVAYIIDITFKKEAEQQLLAHRDRIERLNADLEQKVADRTHALMNTLEQLEQSRDELNKALTAERQLGELKSRFVSMASHEFRTPLTTILSSAALIEKYPDSSQQDKRQKHLQRIHTSVKYLNDILEEFLSLGRIEEGKVESRPVLVDLNKLVQDTVSDMKGMLKERQTIQTTIDCPELCWLDPSLLRKILVNLISNAIKYSNAGSVVSITGTCADSVLTLTVTDQGMGIAPEDQEHLFQRFFRAKNVTNIPGTGLGLHIVAQYTKLLGGQVTLTSELNQGTTVTLTLPHENHPLD